MSSIPNLARISYPSNKESSEQATEALHTFGYYFDHQEKKKITPYSEIKVENNENEEKFSLIIEKLRNDKGFYLATFGKTVRDHAIKALFLRHPELQKNKNFKELALSQFKNAFLDTIIEYPEHFVRKIKHPYIKMLLSIKQYRLNPNNYNIVWIDDITFFDSNAIPSFFGQPLPTNTLHDLTHYDDKNIMCYSEGDVALAMLDAYCGKTLTLEKGWTKELEARSEKKHVKKQAWLNDLTLAFQPRQLGKALRQKELIINDKKNKTKLTHKQWLLLIRDLSMKIMNSDQKPILDDILYNAPNTLCLMTLGTSYITAISNGSEDDKSTIGQFIASLGHYRMPFIVSKEEVQHAVIQGIVLLLQNTSVYKKSKLLAEKSIKTAAPITLTIQQKEQLFDLNYIENQLIQSLRFPIKTHSLTTRIFGLLVNKHNLSADESITMISKLLPGINLNNKDLKPKKPLKETIHDQIKQLNDYHEVIKVKHKKEALIDLFFCASSTIRDSKEKINKGIGTATSTKAYLLNLMHGETESKPPQRHKKEEKEYLKDCFTKLTDIADRINTVEHLNNLFAPCLNAQNNLSIKEISLNNLYCQFIEKKNPTLIKKLNKIVKKIDKTDKINNAFSKYFFANNLTAFFNKLPNEKEYIEPSLAVMEMVKDSSNYDLSKLCDAPETLISIINESSHYNTLSAVIRHYLKATNTQPYEFLLTAPEWMHEHIMKEIA